MLWGGKSILSKNDNNVNRDVRIICIFLKKKSKRRTLAINNSIFELKKEKIFKNRKYFKK